VIDLRVRPHVQGILEPIGRFLVRLGVGPTFLTMLGLAVAVAGATIVGLGRPFAGGLVFLAGSALDGLDGSVARAADRVSSRGAFLDAGVDRLGEVAVLIALAVDNRDDTTILLVTMLAMAGALMIPYIRAKAEAEGLDGRGGLMGRAERVLLVAAALLTGWIAPILWFLMATSWFTVGQRFWTTYRSIET
jgi:CDP-diacylglycerol---glycerol-3-phosphate 3-phosphatidyltransferase